MSLHQDQEVGSPTPAVREILDIYAGVASRKSEWGIHRQFVPIERYDASVTHDMIEIARKDFTHVASDRMDSRLRSGKLPPLINSMVIAIHGVCEPERENARSAIGYYFGEKGDNFGGIIFGREHNTELVEIRATFESLKRAIVLKQTTRWQNMALLVIKSDSDFIVNKMSKWIHNWDLSQWQFVHHHNRLDLGMLKDIFAQIKELNSAGVEVLFWKVTYQENKEALELAHQALNNDDLYFSV
ncbi:hypothetical protein BJ875DRAFT_487629 [Amylocarpus encephaloides]|uniref:RNase H type-1 domain-containing protein n=1 Tax=Amylocarpus encephaloides TaxID=45428 RepID=A0A9P7YBS2_9HELO|nr:hypothetical protein BJ875DRAFT_487629 [Amylocarpus encephaloides]